MSASKYSHDETLSTTRIEIFSDAIMAIIMTLLVLEIELPVLPEGFTNQQALDGLIHVLPHFLSFTLSFLVIAIIWVNHHHFFHRLRHADRGLLWFNNLLLFWICFIPFPTSFVGEYYTEPVPVLFYGVVFFFMATSFALAHYHACNHGLFRQDVSKAFLKREVQRSFVAPILYLISVPVALFSPSAALGIFVLVPLLYFLPAATVMADA
ncbi:MAG: TMEM175 family protein [Candidatus Altimarinota bacterium]